QVLEAMPFPIVVTRVDDGAILMFNPLACELFGIAAEGMGERTALWYYANPDDRDRLLTLLSREGRVDGLEVALKGADGEPVWVLMSVRWLDFQGNDALLSAFTVIDERKRMEQELTDQWNLLRTVLESISQGLTAFGPEFELLAWNRRFFDLLDMPAEYGSYRRPYADLLRFNAERGEYGAGDVETLVAARLEEARRVEPHRFEQTRPDGRVIEVEGRPMPGGGFVTTYTDITERRRQEDEVRTAKEKAEGALNELQATQETLIQSEKLAALGSLVAGIAHEINTPIGVTLTAASLLGERVGAIRADFEQGRLRKPDFADFLDTATETVELMMANIHRASELIHSFKQVAVDQASEERRVFDLKTYLHEVLRSLSVQIRKAGHAVVVDCPEFLEVDGFPGALSQVLTNFVMNALVHGFEPDVSGALSIKAGEGKPGEIEVRFSDNGKGIPPEYRTRIFDPFFTTRRGRGGSGLGLNIVYNIVTRTLKGRVSMESEVGKGTAFTIRFPRVMPAGEGK
ncbi:MAG TPA: PAS-domain containing protein, partial [Azospirillaceae bacterium]|nr:PAS-domain containing protein [Azospirillaceae bacterium]